MSRAIRIAAPPGVSLRSGTTAYAGCPEVEETRFPDAEANSDDMHDQRNPDNPHRLENQEELGCKNAVGDNIVVGDTCQHLRPRESQENAIPL